MSWAPQQQYINYADDIWTGQMPFPERLQKVSQFPCLLYGVVQCSGIVPYPIEWREQLDNMGGKEGVCLSVSVTNISVQIHIRVARLFLLTVCGLHRKRELCQGRRDRDCHFPGSGCTRTGYLEVRHPHCGVMYMVDYTWMASKCHSVKCKWDILIMPNIPVLLHHRHRPLSTGSRSQGGHYSRKPFLMGNNGQQCCLVAPLHGGMGDNTLMKWC
jgi:hypothetical protein